MAARVIYEEEQLVRLLQGLDKSAFSYLDDHYSASIFGVISRIVPDEEIAADVLQESFLKIWNNISSYDKSKGRLFTWMLNIARNTAIDETRSKQFKVSEQNHDIEDSVDIIDSRISALPKTDHIGLKEVVSKLRTEHQEIIELLYFKGYTQEETAKELNIPLGTIKTRSRSAIQQLRTLLNLNKKQ